ncbi:MAG: hypothetical protein ACR2JC_17145 [Chloroflexota bacterium]
MTIRWNCSVSPCTDRPVLGQARTDETGRFSLSVQIPSTATVGTYDIGGLQNSGGVFAIARFSVQPALAVSPRAARSGFGVNVTGTGYAPNQRVSIIWNCATRGCTSTTVLGFGQSNGNGDFTVAVTVPTSFALEPMPLLDGVGILHPPSPAPGSSSCPA